MEAVEQGLYSMLRMCDQGTVVSKQEVAYDGCLKLCRGKQAPDVKQITIHSIRDWNAFLAVLKKFVLLLTALLLELSHCEHHVYRAASSTKATLALRQYVKLIDMFGHLLNSQFSMTRARILPGIDNNEIPRWSSQTERSPLSLKM